MSPWCAPVVLANKAAPPNVTCYVPTATVNVCNQSFMFTPTYEHPHIHMAPVLTTVNDDHSVQLRGVNLSTSPVYLPVRKVLGDLSYIAEVAMDAFDMANAQLVAQGISVCAFSMSASTLPVYLHTIECRVPNVSIPSHVSPLQRYRRISSENIRRTCICRMQGFGFHVVYTSLYCTVTPVNYPACIVPSSY